LKAQTRAGKVIGARIDAIVVRSMTTHRERLAIAVATAFLLVVPTCSPAFAHTGSGSGGFVGGFLHPMFGPDHLVAMLAVGLWGAFLGPPAIWLLPIVFPLVMAGGGVMGILGVPLPGVEIGIAISAIVLGLMVALAARPPLWVAAVLVGAFAISTGMRTAASFRLEPTPLPSPSASWSPPECCISPASPSACSRAGPPAASPCAPPAERLRSPGSPS
jgi:urease accessory protein